MINKVGITVTTDDDDTVDALLDLFERFAKDEVRNLLNIHDPLAKVMVDDSSGFVLWC